MKSDSFVLRKLLESIDDNELQIPDFQRDWVWKDKQIKSLIESVIRGFPINSIMLLECDATSTRFSYKPIKGVTSSAAPRYLVLDGQQRLTSLYCALFSDKPVELPDGSKCFYYIDMQKRFLTRYKTLQAEPFPTARAQTLLRLSEQSFNKRKIPAVMCSGDFFCV